MAAALFNNSSEDIEMLREAGETEQELALAAASKPICRFSLRKCVALLAAASAAVVLVRAAAPAWRRPGHAASLQAAGVEQTIGLKEEEQESARDKPVFKKCLCVFDIDRTLTGKQGWEEKCPKAQKISGVRDQAYGQGTLMASDLAQSMDASFCGECYHSIVTAGQASGPNSDERAKILDYIGGTDRTRSDYWQDLQFNMKTPVVSSMIVQASDGLKQEAVKGIVHWWRTKQKLDIADEDVYFFDDVAQNVLPFKDTGFNARQVSCATRDNVRIGGCGGELDELKMIKGVHICDAS